MRVLFGLILGCLLTIGGAYLYDSHKAMAAQTSGAMPEQSLVNWPVVEQKWGEFSGKARVKLEHLGDRAKDTWNKHAG